MSKIKLEGNATGTGTLTISAPATNTDRSLTLPDTAGEFVTADASGNVGIGTSSPATSRRIHTYGSPVIGAKFESTSTSGSGIEFADADTTNAVQIGSDANDFTVDTNFTERMRIDSSGKVAVGTTSPTHGFQVTGEYTGTGTGVALFQNTHDSVTNGDEVVRIQFSGDNDATGGHFVNFYDSGGDIGRINVASASTTQYATTSDYRLKENIVDIENAIDTVKLLKPKNFNFIKNPSVSMDGFIAHELQEVIPIAVDGVKDQMRTVTNDDGEEVEEIYPQAVDASKVIPVLTQALKDAIAKIEALETRIEALENA